MYRNQPKVILHVGVHKTATTYTQSRLANSRDTLAKHGINYIPLNSLRKRLTAQLGQRDFTPQKIYHALEPFLDCKRLVISDENIIGGLAAPKDYIYPHVGYRIGKILDALKSYDVTVFISIRTFSDYFVSRYFEALRHRPFCSFEKYMSGLSVEQMSWVPILHGLCRAGAQKICVSDFSYVVSGDDFLCHILGEKLSLAEAHNSPGTLRSKLSREAYDVVKAYAMLYSTKSTNKLVRLMDQCPQQYESTPFAPFSTDQIHLMKKRYDSDLQRIKSDKKFIFIPREAEKERR